MCGLAGYLSASNVEQSPNLNEMLSKLEHRGPDMRDTKSTEIDDRKVFWLGSTRLAIQDTTENAIMPMESKDGRFIMAFNGEIYNFLELKSDLESSGTTFHTRSDTEVLLKMFEIYGLEALSKLNGMFAIALFDKKLDVLYLVRDRLGVKPLFFHKYGSTLAFASELKALLINENCKFSLDQESLVEFLSYGYVPAPNTIVSNIFKVEPAHYLKIDKELNIESIRWWDLKASTEGADNRIPKNETKSQQLVNLLRDATEKRMISDVPVGLFLSSGVDSSLLAYLSKDISRTILETYTAVFADLDRFTDNEGAKTAKFTENLGVSNTQVPVQFGEFRDRLREIVNYCDEPVGESLVVALNELSKEASKKCTVIISGEGADEIFGGYSYYRLDLYRASIWFLPKFVKKFVASKILEKKSISYKQKALLAICQESSAKLWETWSSMFNKNEINDLIDGAKFRAPLSQRVGALYGEQTQFFKKNTLQLCDLHFRLPDFLLTVRDRMTMAHSLELRSPFLDYRIAEFGFKIHRSLKFGLSDTKRIVFELPSLLGIEKILSSKKKYPFQSPLENWLEELVPTFLFDPKLVQYKILDKNALDSVLKNIKGKFGMAKLWNLLVLEIWIREYGQFFIHESKGKAKFEISTSNV